MFISGPLAPVDKEDFKKVWQLRREFGNSTIDAEIFRRVCKQETDFQAAAHRAVLLSVLLKHYPAFMAPYMTGGDFSDPFLEAFAAFPIEGGTIDFNALEASIRT